MQDKTISETPTVSTKDRQRCQYRSPLARHWPRSALWVQDCQSLHGTQLRQLPLQHDWCRIHQPFISSNDDEEFEEFNEYLVAYAKSSLDSDNTIELSGLSWQFPRDVIIEKEGVFGQTESDQLLQKCRLIQLHDSKFGKDVIVRSLSKNDLVVDMSFAEIKGSLIIDRVDLSYIDLSNAKIHGNVEIRNANIGRGISLRDIDIFGSLEIDSNTTIGSDVSFSGAKVRKSFEIRHSCFGEDQRSNPNDYPKRSPRNSNRYLSVQLDDAYDQVSTKFGSFTLKDVTFNDRCEFGRVDIERFLDFSDVRFLGGLSFDRASVINDSIITDLTIELPSNPNERMMAETRRAIRAFREIARASGNTAASSKLIREERAVLAKQRKATKIQNALWWMHDMVSESNLSWELPAAFLLGQAALFASLISFFEPPTLSGLTKACALSLANTFAPFVSLQVSILVGDISTIMLSIVQSAIAAGLISTLIMAIRESFE